MTAPPRSPSSAFVRALWILLQNPAAFFLEAALGLVTLLAFFGPVAAGYVLLRNSLGTGETLGSWGRAAGRAIALGEYFDQTLTPVWSALVLLLVTLTVAFFLACAVKAAIAGAVSEADRLVLLEPAPKRAFRLPPGRFLHHLRRSFWPVFWLLNLYALAISIFLGLFLIALAWLALGLLNHAWGVPAAAVAVSGLALTGAGLFLRLVTFVSTWRIVEFGDGVADSLKNGWNRLRDTGWHAVAAWILVIAFGMVLGAILSIPRAILQFFIDDIVRDIPLLVFWLSLTLLLQIVSTAILEVLQTAALVSVFNGRAAPPVGFSNHVHEAPPSLPSEDPALLSGSTPLDEALPFPEAALPPEPDPESKV
ncbi:MAG: hypothetical protein L6R30_16225 [Thermoanaerobaculia bacterium]|nr:hypothetical protein [Thermoanaerobaculia bacterium]